MNKYRLMIASGKANVQKALQESNSINNMLIDLTQQLYSTQLTKNQIDKICAMSYLDKLWLVAQYRIDLRMDTPPNLSNLD